MKNRNDLVLIYISVRIHFSSFFVAIFSFYGNAIVKISQVVMLQGAHGLGRIDSTVTGAASIHSMHFQCISQGLCALYLLFHMCKGRSRALHMFQHSLRSSLLSLVHAQVRRASLFHHVFSISDSPCCPQHLLKNLFNSDTFSRSPSK